MSHMQALNVSSQYQANSVPVKEIGQKLLWSTGCSWSWTSDCGLWCQCYLIIIMMNWNLQPHCC